MSTAERLARLPVADQRRLEPVMDALLEELLRLSPSELARLAPIMTATDSELGTLERRNLLRALDLWREIEGASLSGPELQTALGVGRESLRQMRTDGRLLGVRVPGRRDFRYPRWQFDTRGRPRPELRELLAAAREAGLEALDVHLILTNPAAGEGGQAPAESLATEPGAARALDLLRAGAEGW